MVIDEFLKVGSESRCESIDSDLLHLFSTDQLEGGHLLDVRLVTTVHTVGLLLDLRHAVDVWKWNTGILVLRNVDKMLWTTILPDPNKKKMYGNTSIYMFDLPDFEIAVDGGRTTLTLGYREDQRLTVVAGSMALFYGDVESIPTLQPSLPDDRDAIQSWQFQSWNSEMTLRGVSTLADLHSA